MATLHPLSQENSPGRDGKHFVITKVRVTGDGDTVSLPEGLASANHVAIFAQSASDTSATVSSITQNAHPQGATLTIAGGTADSLQYVISMHVGNAAGL